MRITIDNQKLIAEASKEFAQRLADMGAESVQIVCAGEKRNG